MVQQFELYRVMLKRSHCSQVFSRRDQLSLRASKKEQNKDKKAKGKEAKQKNDTGKKKGKGKGKRKGATGNSTDEIGGQDDQSSAVTEPTDKKMTTPLKRSKLQKMKAASAAASAASAASSPKADGSKRKRKPAPDADDANGDTKSRKVKKKVQEVCGEDVKNFKVQQTQITEWINQNIDYEADLETYKEQVNAAKSKFTFFLDQEYLWIGSQR